MIRFDPKEILSKGDADAFIGDFWSYLVNILTKMYAKNTSHLNKIHPKIKSVLLVIKI